MYEYHGQYERAHERNDDGAQARWARQLTWEVARHAVGEEIVVYPLMEQYLGQKGLELANHDREEHLVCISVQRACNCMSSVLTFRLQRVKEDLYKLESLKPGSQEFHELMGKMMESLRHHNESEENNDLPLLKPAIGKTMSVKSAESFKTTKKFVPTRSVVLVIPHLVLSDN